MLDEGIMNKLLLLMPALVMIAACSNQPRNRSAQVTSEDLNSAMTDKCVKSELKEIANDPILSKYTITYGQIDDLRLRCNNARNKSQILNSN